jgi:hypothetical protein
MRTPSAKAKTPQGLRSIINAMKIVCVDKILFPALWIAISLV